MFTQTYRGYFIQGYCDKDDCRVITPQGRNMGYFPSYRSAQLAITRNIQS